MDINQIIESTQKLPPTPQILPKIQSLLRDQDAGLDELIDLIKMDSSLAVQVVRISNSAYYGAASPATTIDEAVQRVGLYEVYKLVSFVASNLVFAQGLEIYKLDPGELWKQSLYCGSIAKQLAAIVSSDADSAYMMGLVHSIGKVVINHYFLDHGIEIYTTDNDNPVTPDQESQLLGFNFAEVGSLLLKQWNFPDDITHAVTYQLNPLDSKEYTQQTIILNLSYNFVPLIENDSEDPLAQYMDSNSELIGAAALQRENMELLLDRSRKEIEKVQELMSQI